MKNRRLGFLVMLYRYSDHPVPRDAPINFKAGAVLHTILALLSKARPVTDHGTVPWLPRGELYCE